MVLIDGDTKLESVECAVTAALAKFDENIEVPEYDKPCYCIGMAARSAARSCADERAGTVDSIRKAHNHDADITAKRKRHTDLEFSKTKLTAEEKAEFKELDELLEARWGIAIAPYLAAERSAFDSHPDKASADKECDDCRGTGSRKSTGNPIAKWDWWVIGGRWAGWIRGAEDSMPNDDVGSFGTSAHQQTRAIRNATLNNSRHVNEFPSPIPDDVIPFAIVTPDGQWNQKGDMGWFGMASNEKDDWKDEARGILAAHPTALAVAVDLHI